MKESDPELEEEVNRRVLWFKKNTEDTRLGSHELHRGMKGKCAFEITGDIRIVYKWVGRNAVTFLDIGGHEEVYDL